MDLFRFIDSKDIREHLRQMGYSFTAPEAAFLVWQCRSTTLKEKIAAWREIIETMPDCSMVERMNMDAIPSVHKFLEQYIALMERLLANFYCEEHAVYSYSGSYRDGSDFEEEYNRLYPDIVSCVAGFLNDEFVPFVPKVAHMIEDYLQILAKRTCKSLPPYPVSLHTDHNFEIGSIRFKKRSLTSPGESITLILNDRLEPVAIDTFGQFLTKEEENLLLTFQGMWFAFPTPFKRGRSGLGSFLWRGRPFCSELFECLGHSGDDTSGAFPRGGICRIGAQCGQAGTSVPKNRMRHGYGRLWVRPTGRVRRLERIRWLGKLSGSGILPL